MREITLLGQNVNAYHGAGPDGAWGLARLIRELARIDGLERLRYTTSHPNDMDDDLIAAHGEVPKLMPYLHLPVQSGSDRILKAMNRKHTADALSAAGRAHPRRAARHPAVVAISSSASPARRDADFEATLDLIRAVGFGAGLQLQVFRPPRHARRPKSRRSRPRSPMPGCRTCRR